MCVGFGFPTSMLISLSLPLLCNCKCDITSYIALSDIPKNSLNWYSYPISLIHYIWHSRARGIDPVYYALSNRATNHRLVLLDLVFNADFTPYYQCLSFDLVMHLHNPSPYRVNIVPEIVAHDRCPCFVHRFTHSIIICKCDLHNQICFVNIKKNQKEKDTTV